jgi:hypothetical protein
VDGRSLAGEVGDEVRGVGFDVDVGARSRASDIRASCVVTYWFVAPGVPLEPARAFF